MKLLKGVLAISVFVSAGAFADNVQSLDQCASAFAKKSNLAKIVNGSSIVAAGAGGVTLIAGRLLNWSKPIRNATLLATLVAGTPTLYNISQPRFYRALSDALTELSRGTYGPGIHSLTEESNEEIFGIYGSSAFIAGPITRRQISLMKNLNFNVLRDEDVFKALEAMFNSGQLCGFHNKTTGIFRFINNLVLTVATQNKN